MSEIDDTLRQWVCEDDSRLRKLLRDLEQWRERLDDAKFREFQALFECIRNGDGTPLSFDGAIEAVKAGIGEILKRIQAIRTEAIRDTPVSRVRLEEVGRWASAQAFNKATAAFPLPLFGMVDSSPDEFTSRSLVIKEMQKGEFTEPPMAQRAGNEAEWFGKVVRDHVAASVLAETLKKLKPQEVDGNSPEVYWEQVKAFAREAERAHLQAALLVENPTVPDWLWEWTHPSFEEEDRLPPDLEVWRNSEFEMDGYLGNLSRVPVFDAPLSLGNSYLIAIESLEAVTFTRLPNGNLVAVTAEPVADKHELVDLHLTWRFRLSLKPYPAVRLTYGLIGRHGLKRGRRT